MEVRRLQSDDLNRVTELAAQLGYSCSIDEMSRRFQEINTSPNHALFVATSIDGAVIGWTQVNREPQSLISEARAEISALVVDEQFRGQKAGAALVQKAEEWALLNKLPLMRVRSNVVRERAHKFYLREGYEIKKSWHLFAKPLTS